MKRLDINKSNCFLVKLVFLSLCTEKRVTENSRCVYVQLIHIAGQGHEIHSDSVVLCVGCLLLVFNECGLMSRWSKICQVTTSALTLAVKVNSFN